MSSFIAPHLPPTQPSGSPSKASVWQKLTAFSALLSVLFGGVLLLTQARPVHAAGNLQVSIVAGYNLVVDSNVESPSTYAPSVATVMGRFCNTGDAPLTNVQGFIGNYTGSGAVGGTPGVYPVRDSSQAPFIAQHPHLSNTGNYAFTHVGGRIGTADASRYIGTLAAGQCRVQYWHMTYPRRANPNNSGVAIWGQTNVDSDDLWLDFDVWGSSAEGSANDKTWTMTMRNEISAMANKIKPNPDGQWFNTNTAVVNPGDTITSNGILYELGVINQGFDNDGNFTPDFNAWLQPIGDPSYDPSCFRLIGTTGVITVSRSGGNPDTLINFTDQLYFTSLPDDNNGVMGEVRYTFMALDGPCNTALTPYQEVASGYNNEKFNGDYGVGIPPVASYEPQVTIDKTSSPNTVALGGTVTYQIPLNNGGSTAAGLPLSTGGPSLVISDTIPAGMVYVANSASANVGVTLRFFNGTVWGTKTGGVEPFAAANVRAIQWLLDNPLNAGASATGTFQATVPVAYAGPSFIPNNACASFGNGVAFACADTVTMVQGTSTIGDFVWRDLDTDGAQDGGAETGIANISMFLYWDKNGDGLLDDGDVQVSTQTTNGSGGYDFTQLPIGKYIVTVDGLDPDLPTGYNYTTPKTHAVNIVANATDYNAADFGFGPILSLIKSLTNGQYDGVNNDNIYEGQLAKYQINVINTRPGGTGPGNSCQYTIWASTAVSSGAANSQWQNMGAAAGPADSAFAYTVMANNPDDIDLSGYLASGQAGNITNVKYVMLVKELVEMDAGDSMDVLITSGATTIYDSTTLGDFNLAYFSQSVGYLYNATIDLGTSLTWASFAPALNVNILGNRGGGTSGELALDAAAFIITTDQICGDPADTLNPVPVSDTYDATKLEFVSANPTVSSQTPGTLTWNNVGPLVAGETQPIEVVFKVLQPVANGTIATNTASSTGAKYLNGRDANNASDSVDADMFTTVKVGDTVWFDANGNGTQQAGEPGLAGVVVQLRLTGNTTIFYNGQSYVGPNVLIATTITDANGNYIFEGVPGDPDGGPNPYDYSVTINTAASPILTGLTATTAGGNVQASDNLVNTDDLARDFGYNSANSMIYGSVWHDKDADAVDPTIDTTETYISGVTVRLCSDAAGTTCVATTTTDANGRYQFTNVPNGTYFTVVTPPGTQVATPTGPNTKVVCGLCNNASPAIVVNSVSPAFIKVYGAYDFGYTGVNIGDTIYVDWNGNGTQDTGEEGIPNVDVKLYRDVNGNGLVDAGDTLLQTATTNASGQYLFTNYPKGFYLVMVDTGDVPASYVQTADPDATRDSKTVVTLNLTTVLTADFGYQPTGTGSIGDYVWRDINNNTNQDPAELPIANITVRLYEDSNGNGTLDANDALVATASTNASGNYLFTNLAAGRYLVDVDTADTDLPNDGYGNDYVLTTANDPKLVILSAGQSYLDADFGFAPGGVIGDYIWQDNNGDGVQDIGEPALPGVVVELQNGTCTPSVNCPTATTNASGLYSFTSLPAGTYTVRVLSGVPAGFIQTGDPDLTSPCSGGTCDNLSTLTLTPGQVDRSRDFGFKPAVVLGDYVWVDQDGDGVQDAGESGLGGVKVTLALQAGGTLVTYTDSDGYYSFGNVPNGTHNVTVDSTTLPVGLTPTYDLNGTGTPHTTAVTISNASNLNVDFGYRYVGIYSIAGTVFYDTDQSGGDAVTGDATYVGVTVYLWLNGQIIAQTASDFAGNYTFGNLPNGNYTVSVDGSSPALLGHTHTTNSNQNDGSAYENVTIANASVVDVDFGFYGVVSPTAVALRGTNTRPVATSTTWVWFAFVSLLLFTAMARTRRHGHTL